MRRVVASLGHRCPMGSGVLGLWHGKTLGSERVVGQAAAEAGVPVEIAGHQTSE